MRPKFCSRRVALLSFVALGLLVIGEPAGGFSFSNTADEDKAATDPVYEPGGEVRAPKLVHYVEPQFNGDSKEAFVEGTVKISTIVTLEGTASECRVTTGLTAGQDKTALEALKQWRFQPGTKGGKSVRVRVTVEVGFHLL